MGVCDVFGVVYGRGRGRWVREIEGRMGEGDGEGEMKGEGEIARTGKQRFDCQGCRE